MEDKKQELIKFFTNIPEFHFLPEFYKDRIISFFLEDRHYMVDHVDVQHFLDGCKQCTVFKCFEDLTESHKVTPVQRILGCKRHFTSLAELSKWLDKLSEVENGENIMILALTHSFGFEFDEPEEWYIAAY